MNVKHKQLIIRLSAIGEILLILIIGSVLSKLILRTFFDHDFLEVQYIPLAGNGWKSTVTEAVKILIHFGVLLIMAFGSFRLIHRVKPSEAGISRNNRSILSLLVYGVVLFAISGLPWKLVVLTNQVAPFGEGLHGWDDINMANWSIAVVALILARAVLLPPVCEEPVVRGYVFHRLRLEYGEVGAILLSSVIFVFSHGHLSSSDPVIIALVVSSIFSSACWALATKYTGSIIPAIVAHAFLNSPEPSNPIIMTGIICCMIAIIITARKQIKHAIWLLKSLWIHTSNKIEVIYTTMTLGALMILGAQFKIVMYAVVGVTLVIVPLGLIFKKSISQIKITQPKTD